MRDIVIIGGGVIGCGVARLLSAYDADITLIERGHDVAEGASKANSGIVHAGFDAQPGTLKAKLNVEGSRMFPSLCEELNVPYEMTGALVLAFNESGCDTVRRLYEQGMKNGVERLSVLGRDELINIEPNVNPEVMLGLCADTSGIVSPYELTYALADHAALNGVEFLRNAEALCVEPLEAGEVEMGAGTEGGEGGFRIKTSRGDILTRIVVNCAGVSAHKLHNQISDRQLDANARKGEYYLFDRMTPLPFARTIFQTPTRMGKGVLVSPTVHGNLLLGPTAQDVDDDTDVSTTAAGLHEVLTKVKLTWPHASLHQAITSFAGIRAHEKGDDFIVGAVEDVPGAYETVGIESPGLSAAPAIAKTLCELIVSDMRLVPKNTWKPYGEIRKATPFSEMTLEERLAAVERDPEYGNLVCRCEQVTEAEVRAAIRRPVGARSIDGVKRRVRAGMGRCQGGFCSPRVLEILTEELGVSPLEVTKCGGESVLLVRPIGGAEVLAL